MPSKNVALVAGLLITISSAAAQNKTYAVRQGDTLETIAQRLNVPAEKLLLANKLSEEKLEQGMVIQVPEEVKTTGTTKYEVKKGDSDWILAHRFNTTTEKLKALNPSVDWKHLKLGSKLVVPATNPDQKTALTSRNAVVTASNVIIRRQPSTSAEKVTLVDSGTRVEVLDRQSGWYKLKFPKGTVGWVRGDLLSDAPAATKVAAKPSPTRVAKAAPKKSTPSAKAAKPVVTTDAVAEQSSGSALELMTKAYSLQGTRYRYGGLSSRGLDCSGFTSTVFRAEGIKLPRISRDQAKVGYAVSRSELKAGDLVFFKTTRSSRISHVGIYAGNGKFIHASSGHGRVRVDNLSDSYYSKRMAGARRVTDRLKHVGKAEEAKYKATVAKTTEEPSNIQEWAKPVAVLPKSVRATTEEAK